MDLERRLRECLCRSTAVEILDGCEKYVTSSSGNADLQGLLLTVLLEYSHLSKHLTESELSNRLNSLFIVCPYRIVPPALCSALKEGVDPTALISLIRLAERGVPTVLSDSLRLEQNDEISESNLRNWVNSVLQMVDLFLAKLMKSDFEGVLLCRKMCTIVAEAVSTCLTLTVQRIREEKDANLKIVAYTVLKARNLVNENGHTLIDLLVSHCRSLPSCPLTDRVYERVFTDASGGRHAQQLVEMIVGAARSGTELMRLFGLSVRHSRTLFRVCHKLLLQRACGVRIPHTLTEYLHLALAKEQYQKLIMDAACLWADPASLAHSPLPLLQYRTRVLLLLGHQTRDDGATDLWEEVFPVAARGVQTSLGRPEVSVRQMGMLVGEQCSKWMGKDGLKFDYEEDAFTDEMRRLLSGENFKEAGEEPGEKELPILPPPSLDSLSIKNERVSVSAAPLDSDDEEDFLPYDVPETEKTNATVLEESSEPEKKHAPPSYIRDAMEWLDEKDKYDKFEAAFFALEGLIRRRAMGFDEISFRLVQKIIYMENKFNTKRFEDIRRSILVACLVTCTTLVPPTIDLIYSRSCALVQKFLIVDCVISAAKELSEPTKEDGKIPTISKKKAKDSEEIEDTKSDWRAVIDARVRAKTRYFHSARSPDLPSHKNRLIPVVDLFVYPLLRTTVGGEHLELQGRDCAFWGRTIFAASEILQYATNAPSNTRIASALADVADQLTHREEPFLKATALFAYCSIVHCMPPSVFSDVFGDRIRAWVTWALEMGNDLDATRPDRELAKQTVNIILSTLRQSEQS